MRNTVRHRFPFDFRSTMLRNLAVTSLLLLPILAPAEARAATLPTVATPTFSPAKGSYTGTQNVKLLDSNAKASIYYTLDGTTPTTAAPLYSSAAPIAVSTSLTLKAIAVASGYNNSAVASAAYTIKIPTPVFSLAAGAYGDTQSLTLSDATIYYTTDGTTPTTSSSTYQNPLVLSTSTTVKAFAVLAGATNSSLATAAYTIVPTPSTGMWGWMGGSNAPAPASVYGTANVAALANIPGGRDFATTWKDSSGNVWIFGASGAPSPNGDPVSNELWKYSPSTNEWTWISGGPNDTKNTNPIARGQAAGWIDAKGDLFLFGGQNNGQTLNDFWEYIVGTGWKQLAGDPTLNSAPGTYTAVGQAGYPAARFGASTWFDKSGNAWLFGGTSDPLPCGTANDLWEYKASQWIWVSGSNPQTQTNCAATYGTKGVAAAANYPPGRAFAASWFGTDGKLYLFGGSQCQLRCDLGDLWSYNTTTKYWTWVNGPSTQNTSGVYGTAGVFAATNQPGARAGSNAWVTSTGDVWLFGGGGLDSVANQYGLLNDLWLYRPSLNLWLWVDGSSLALTNGNPGTESVFAATNTPNPVWGASGWADSSGNLYLFAGQAGITADPSGYGPSNLLMEFKLAK